MPVTSTDFEKTLNKQISDTAAGIPGYAVMFIICGAIFTINLGVFVVFYGPGNMESVIAAFVMLALTSLVSMCVFGYQYVKSSVRHRELLAQKYSRRRQA